MDAPLDSTISLPLGAWGGSLVGMLPPSGFWRGGRAGSRLAGAVPSWSLILGVALCAFVAGCDEKAEQKSAAVQEGPRALADSPEAMPGTASPGAGDAEAAVAAEAKSSYEDQAFKLELGGPAEVTVGQAVELSVVLTARGGFKVNSEYPIKFKLQKTPGVELEAEVVEKESGEVDEHRAELPVRVKATQKGTLTVVGRLSFSVCTDDRCLIERRDLKATLNAS